MRTGKDKEKKSRPYGVAGNVWFMVRLAWTTGEKKVLVLNLLSALCAVGLELIGLYLSPTVLAAVERHAPVGQLLGMNGSGKTTFIKLLCRLYDPTEGEILLNGIDIRKYSYREYMDLFSVVFQDFQLFALPLGENVACGTDCDAARAVDCLEKAGFAQRLAALPQAQYYKAGPQT